ncbi:hypothetical protein D022_1541 [Vibrio parahaemolyticus 12310]|nr:hypothetical protein D022_1541 [Vibrio parahaemolyticus 12310]
MYLTLAIPLPSSRIENWNLTKFESVGDSLTTASLSIIGLLLSTITLTLSLLESPHTSIAWMLGLITCPSKVALRGASNVEQE